MSPVRWAAAIVLLGSTTACTTPPPACMPDAAPNACNPGDVRLCTLSDGTTGLQGCESNAAWDCCQPYPDAGGGDASPFVDVPLVGPDSMLPDF